MVDAITENVGIGLMIVNKEYCILSASNLLKQIFGDNLEQEICYKKLQGRASPCLDCGGKRVFEGSPIDIREGSSQNKSGEVNYTNIVSSPIKDENGNITSVLELIIPVTKFKQMEMKFREAEKRYHCLFDQSPLGVLVVDPKTKRIVEFNDVAYIQLDYSQEEFAKLSLSDIEASETTFETSAHIRKILKTGGDEFETKHRTKKGEICDVLVTTRLIELAGKPYLSCIFHDITETRQVQNALKESETKYRMLVELAHEGVWAFDNALKTVFINPRMTQILGYSGSEMLGRNLFEFMDKEKIEDAKKTLGPYSKGIQGNFEYEFTRKDGTLVYTTITASQIKDDEGNCLGTLALVGDFTERKRAEEQLRKQKENAELYLKIIGHIVLKLDTQGVIQFLNKKGYEVLGYSQGELEGKNWIETCLPKESRDETAGLFYSWVQGKSPIPEWHENPVVTKSGEKRIIKWYNKELKNEQGQPVWLLSSGEDVTNSKKTQITSI
jgi:PAS domain S-box-containing protein